MEEDKRNFFLIINISDSRLDDDDHCDTEMMTLRVLGAS